MHFQIIKKWMNLCVNDIFEKNLEYFMNLIVYDAILKLKSFEFVCIVST